jgi:DNA-binding NtrC family response regulator
VVSGGEESVDAMIVEAVEGILRSRPIRDVRLPKVLKEVEKIIIEAALSQASGSIATAARNVGLSRAVLSSRLRVPTERRRGTYPRQVEFSWASHPPALATDADGHA